MKTENINNLLIEFLDMIQTDLNKVELLIKGKAIKRLVAQAKAEAKQLTDDSTDEITLDFGDKFFKILRDEL